jgi:ribokinase
VAPGANDRFSADGVDIPPAPRGETYVSLFQNEVPQSATEALVRRAHHAGHVVMWNLAPTVSRQPDAAALRAVRYLICNLNELDALVGERRAAASDNGALSRRAHIPLRWGVANVVVTMGKKGSLWVSADGVVTVAAFPVEAVDTVGAGDCYCGVFAASLAQGLRVPDALRRASAAAAISTTRRGAQLSMPMRAEIDDFLNRRGG